MTIDQAIKLALILDVHVKATKRIEWEGENVRVLIVYPKLERHHNCTYTIYPSGNHDLSNPKPYPCNRPTW